MGLFLFTTKPQLGLQAYCEIGPTALFYPGEIQYSISKIGWKRRLKGKDE